MRDEMAVDMETFQIHGLDDEQGRGESEAVLGLADSPGPGSRVEAVHAGHR